MTNKKVLIAEDDDSIARLYQTYLEAHDFVVQRASNGVEASEMLQTFSPHVLLLDIMMPEKSGLDVLKEMKEQQSAVHTIVLSALSNEDEKKKTAEYGAKAYYVKSQALMSDILDKINELTP